MALCQVEFFAKLMGSKFRGKQVSEILLFFLKESSLRDVYLNFILKKVLQCSHC